MAQAKISFSREYLLNKFKDFDEVFTDGELSAISQLDKRDKLEFVLGLRDITELDRLKLSIEANRVIYGVTMGLDVTTIILRNPEILLDSDDDNVRLLFRLIEFITNPFEHSFRKNRAFEAIGADITSVQNFCESRPVPSYMPAVLRKSIIAFTEKNLSQQDITKITQPIEERDYLFPTPPGGPTEAPEAEPLLVKAEAATKEPRSSSVWSQQFSSRRGGMQK